MRILNFGSMNIDYTYQVDHILRPGETLLGSGLETFLGGKGFNQSVALAKAGAEVWHAGLLGEEGDPFLAACEEYGIHTDYIEKIPGRSGHTIIQVDADGQNSILLFGGANQAVTPDYAEKVLANFGEGDLLLLQNEVSSLPKIIELAGRRGMQIVLNPSPINAQLSACDLSKVSVFLVNEIEGEAITGESEPDRIVEAFLKQFPKARLVLTLGSRGSIYADASMQVSQPIFPVKAVDTTAAGDCFTGYFIAGLARGEEIPEILRTASKASSIAVSRKGASPSIPRRDEL